MTQPRTTSIRFAEIGAVAASVRLLLRRINGPLALLLAAGTAYLWFSDNPGVNCFALTSIGTMIVLWLWQNGGIGPPIVPLLAIQNLLLYGLPVLTKNETVMKYPESLLTSAGLEILVFSFALAAAWRFGVMIFRSGSRSCFALQGFSDERMTKLFKLGFGLAIAATSYNILSALDLLRSVIDLLPAGTYSIISAVISGMTACGFFLSAFVVGSNRVPANFRWVFWGMLAANCTIIAAGFLLSGTTTLLLSVATGLFWSTGRVPWRFLLVTCGALAFLNIGKFEMRDRYWGENGESGPTAVTFGQMPGYYREWAETSFDILLSFDAEDKRTERLQTAKELNPEQPAEGQSLVDRINNLQNILFVMDAVRNKRGTLLEGATYTLIPPLLVPRVLWPDKPRSHEGQVLLNVHFGRQDNQSTLRTYVAWGLQAEAYGNFGPVLGNAILGAVIGLLFVWVEKFTARKLLLSLEGFLSFVLFLGMANSFEMVSSVLVTSIFQAFIPVILATLPFVERVMPQRAKG